MKKTRILALVLTLVMLVSMLPLSAMAMTVTIIGAVYDDNDAKLKEDPIDWGIMDTKEGGKKVIVDTDNYSDLIVDTETGELYEIIGLHILNNKVLEKAKKIHVDNDIEEVIIPAAPVAEDFETNEEFEAAYAKWEEKYSEYVLVAYGPHIHKLTKWISDATNHWKNCVQCGEEYLKNNWHYDGDQDGKCDVCEFEIVYYKVSVPDVEGVKSVTLEGPKDDSTAAYNDKITITVEAEEGYTIQDVRVYKVRADGTKDQIIRTVKEYSKVYETVMQNFDCEIVITCTKN